MKPSENHHLKRVEGFVCPVILGSVSVPRANWTQAKYQRTLDGIVLLMHHFAHCRETGLLYWSNTWERAHH